MTITTGRRGLTSETAAEFRDDVERRYRAGIELLWRKTLERAQAGGLDPDDYVRVVSGPLEKRTFEVRRRDGHELSDTEEACLKVEQADYERIMNAAMGA